MVYETCSNREWLMYFMVAERLNALLEVNKYFYSISTLNPSIYTVYKDLSSS